MFLGLADYALRLLSKLARHFSMTLLHFFVRDIELSAARLMRRDLRGLGSAPTLFFQVLLDLTAAWTRCLHVLPRVAFDFGLAARTLLDFVTQIFQTQAQLRAIDGRRVLLRTVKLSRSRRARVAVGALRHIEEHHMRVELGGGVTFHGPARVVLELGRNPFTRGFGLVAAHAGLHIF